MDKPCVACGSRPSDRCHVRSRGAGGGWEEENILLLCRRHHVEQHQIGWMKFSLKYPMVLWELEKKGWRLEMVLGRNKLVKEIK